MSEITRQYTTSPATIKLVERALRAIKNDFMVAEQESIMNPAMLIDYLRLQLSDHEREHFCVICLNNQHRITCVENVFSGTLNHVSIHPRIIARKALLCNAAAVILTHNHPSGEVFPSQADRTITESIVKCLSMLDVKTLDHMIISPGDSYYSFAEHGLL